MIKSALILAVALLNLGLLAVGMTMSLFGPIWGRWLSLVGFLSTAVILCVIALERRNGRFVPIVVQYPGIRYCRVLPLLGITGCAVITAIACVTMGVASRAGGVASGTEPVFAEQAQYRLNSHGHYTTVTRSRYIVVGTAFVVGWYAFAGLFATLGIHLALFGYDPEAGLLENPRRKLGGHHPPADAS
jgi:hypothetical protein